MGELFKSTLTKPLWANATDDNLAASITRTRPRRKQELSSFLANVNSLTFTFAICYRPSVCPSSVVGNDRAPYSGG